MIPADLPRDTRVPRLAAPTAGVLLAGAHVWNEDSLEFHCPRGLLPVANLALLHYQLRWLKEAGVELVLICTNDRPEELESALGGHEAPPVVYYYEDAVPRGPAGCARDAADIVAARHYLVIDGSILPSFDLRSLLERHETQAADATVAVCASPDSASPGSRITPAGVYVFDRAALSWVGQAGYQDLKETLLPRLYTEGARVFGYDVGTPAQRIHDLGSYLAAQSWGVHRRRRDAAWAEEQRWHDDVAVHHSAQMEPTATLVGPLIVGPDCRIGAQAIVVGPAALGRGCRLRRGAVVVQSVLWDCAEVGPGAGVYESVLTRGATIEGGRECVGELIAPDEVPATWTRRARRSTEGRQPLATST